MQKIDIKENPLGLQVFVNGVPDLTLIPKEKEEMLFNALVVKIDSFLILLQRKK